MNYNTETINSLARQLAEMIRETVDEQGMA